MLFRSKLSAPCVFLDNPLPTLNVDAVTVDNFLGIYQGFEYLYRMGHREFGYIKSRFPIICFDQRYQAFKECLRQRGLVFEERYVMNVGYLEVQTEKDVERYLDESESLPTAFLADNDLLACRALQAFKKRGIRVPKEVSFVGFDNRPICSFIEPKVTTVQLPGEEMGEMAVKALVEKIEKTRGYNIKYKIEPRLVEKIGRASCRERVSASV